MEQERRKVLVAMSGGVDSSVAALLLQEQGFDCVGATMLLSDCSVRVRARGTGGACDDWLPDATDVPDALNATDIEDARRVCEALGIEHHMLDMRGEFEEHVVAPFVEAYENGATPNPCVACNKHLKFGGLLDASRSMGCDCIATGHYAKVVEREGGRLMLTRSESDGKDQSYVLYNLTQDQLAHVMFPLGDMDKNAVRGLAQKRGLPVAQKGESQDICFVPDGDYRGFIERYRGRGFEPGNVLDTQGNVVGRHCGAACFTIGQRKGLGVAMGYPAYVCDKDMAANTVVVGTRDDLMSDGCIVEGWNWIAPEPAVGQEIAVLVKTNYRQAPHPATLERLEDGTVRMLYEDGRYPKAVRGQSAVAYSGEFVLGGGIVVASI